MPDARTRGVDVTVTNWASVRASKIAFRVILHIGGGYPYGRVASRSLPPNQTVSRAERGKPPRQLKCDTPQAILGATPISPRGICGGAARCNNAHQLMDTHASEDMHTD